jgi:drug/metabolite transporter (DMT)-like permease
MSQPFVIVSGLGILATLAVILKKYILISLSPLELIFYGHILEFILVILFFLATGKIKSVLQIQQRLHNPQLLLAIIVYACLMIFGTFGILWLVKYKSISKFIPLMAVVSTFLTFLAGVVLYKEKATMRDFAAIIFMCVGIFLMNWK